MSQEEPSDEELKRGWREGWILTPEQMHTAVVREASKLRGDLEAAERRVEVLTTAGQNLAAIVEAGAHEFDDPEGLAALGAWRVAVESPKP